MSTYPLSQVLGKWTQGELTADQAIGHILQHLVAQEQQLVQIRQSLAVTTPPVEKTEEAAQVRRRK